MISCNELVLLFEVYYSDIVNCSAKLLLEAPKQIVEMVPSSLCLLSSRQGADILKQIMG